MTKDIKKGSGPMGGATHPKPDYNSGGSKNQIGKNVPVNYRKINSNASTVANKG